MLYSPKPYATKQRLTKKINDMFAFKSGKDVGQLKPDGLDCMDLLQTECAEWGKRMVIYPRTGSGVKLDAGVKQLFLEEKLPPPGQFEAPLREAGLTPAEV
eukprot:CAMPEP_0175874974 /NCGR_PEP_ID=MMETSP0107_2-20121207/39199_1 /TAXON_ID=195067 ORGANISM="Goniomonas pacifica, Strain CCMP1869" /NCGR_SAMPLE_ID=MMETSP0107_2 /ASSEMBLY_ACC=CAM_ASM_000203 /LENGTH=100 /DNA_ID=CAMNT_0017193945 /DNA_START=1 /DNA_END=300 /DNA_ORIENTATION=+